MTAKRLSSREAMFLWRGWSPSSLRNRSGNLELCGEWSRFPGRSLILCRPTSWSASADESLEAASRHTCASLVGDLELPFIAKSLYGNPGVREFDLCQCRLRLGNCD